MLSSRLLFLVFTLDHPLTATWCTFLNYFIRNKQGQTRFSSYYEWISIDERSALESEIIRKCLSRSELQCSFLEYRGYKVIYRRYASLFFIVGTKPDPFAGEGAENNENELGMLEFIHAVVEVSRERERAELFTITSPFCPCMMSQIEYES